MALELLKKMTSVQPRRDTPVSTEVAEADVVDIAPNSGRAARVGLWALGLGLGGFLVWAAFAPLDEGVPSQGMVAIDTKRKAVQHQTGGIVKDVLVREGDLVKEGQVLVRLDEANTRAGYEQARQRYLSYRTVQSRLLAEQSGATKVKFHPDVVAAAAKDPQIAAQLATQEQLFTSRRAGLQAELQAIEQSIRGLQAQVQAYQGMLASRRSQIALVNEELKSTRDLVKDGYAPRNRQLELERMVAEATGATADLQGNILRAQSQILELRQRTIARQQEYRKEIETQLTEIGREVESEESRYRALSNEMDRVEIRSPATGQVVGLSTQTVGGVVQAGAKLMDIVPGDEPLLLETRVPPHLIDRVQAGLPVDVRFSAFAHSPQLVVEGKVVSISGDLLTDAQGNNPYYLARVAVTAEGYKKLGKHQLQPGMPVEVVFKTGERSLLAYLLHPLTKRIAAAMKEE
jgi:protease secretion system membrane fusion protein